ncbi:MAG: YihY/virulence factor BrkB family protein [Halobacteria archaeon]
MDVGLVRDAVNRAKEKQIMFLAAAVAYYAVLSLIPLVLLIMYLFSTFKRKQVDVIMANLTGGFLPPKLRQNLSTVIAESQVNSTATLLGILVLIWGGTRVFRGLDTAFIMIYGDDTEISFKAKVKKGLIVMTSVVLTIVVIALSMIFIGSRLAITDFLRAVVLTILLLPLYYLYPGSDSISIKKVLPGSAFAATSIILLRYLFHIYVTRVRGATGLIGAVLVLVLWMYIASLAVLSGGILNATLEERGWQESK